MNSPLELTMFVPATDAAFVQAACSCGDTNGLGAGGDCLCGSATGGGR
jgi:hypothetical protein